MVANMRRLIADHADLHNNELPPNYFFPTNNQNADDVTQLFVMLAGPHGTPYSAGLWRLQLRIPEDYPASPPKAIFRTRIWHPNVEPSTGEVCVDTLKRDWESKLTLRDILVTISCLLIHPNPNSALNSMAGSLLQNDYEEFAHQARLMTSLHAPIPFAMKSAVLKAKQRGEDPEMAARIEKEPEFRDLRRAARTASLFMKKRPTASLLRTSDPDDDMDDVENDDKENEPSQSPDLSPTLAINQDPIPAPTQVPTPALTPAPTHTSTRRRGQPLSVLPITTLMDMDMVMQDYASDDEGRTHDGMTESERNIAANTNPSDPSVPSTQNSSVFANRQQAAPFSRPFPSLLNNSNSNDSSSTSHVIFEDNVENDSLRELLEEHNHQQQQRRRSTYGKENMTSFFSSLPKEPLSSKRGTTSTIPMGVFIMKSTSRSSSSSSSLSTTAATKPLSPTKVTKPAYNSNSNCSSGAGTRKSISSKRKSKPRTGLRRL